MGLASEDQRISLVESTTSQETTSTTTSRLLDLTELKMNSLPRETNGKGSGSGPAVTDVTKKLGLGASLKIESPKIQKHFSKLSSHSNVLSAKIGDSLSGYMEKISMKMRTENLGVLSANDFPDRKKSPPTAKRPAEKFGAVEFPLLMSDVGKSSSSSNIYEVIEVPKPGQDYSDLFWTQLV